MTEGGSPGDGGSGDASGPLNVDDSILSPVTYPDVSALVDMGSMQSKSSLPSGGSFEKVMTEGGSPGDGGSRDASGPLNVDDSILSPVTYPDVSALVDVGSMQSKSSLPSGGSFEKAMTEGGSPGDGGSRDASGRLNVDDSILSPVTYPDVSALVDVGSMQSKSSLPSDGSFEKAMTEGGSP